MRKEFIPHSEITADSLPLEQLFARCPWAVTYLQREDGWTMFESEAEWREAMDAHHAPPVVSDGDTQP